MDLLSGYLKFNALPWIQRADPCLAPDRLRARSKPPESCADSRTKTLADSRPLRSGRRRGDTSPEKGDCKRESKSYFCYFRAPNAKTLQICPSLFRTLLGVEILLCTLCVTSRAITCWEVCKTMIAQKVTDKSLKHHLLRVPLFRAGEGKLEEPPLDLRSCSS